MSVSLEERIVEWSASRPAWQRAVLRRVALGDAFSASDYDQLTDALVMSKEAGNSNFSLADLPQALAGDPSVRLLSIADPEHVNALASDKPLTFDATGITIVYGDNGSGKSGYGRLLKRVARARHQEEVLSDVFRDTTLAKPRAALRVKVGEYEAALVWPDSASPELKRMLFYDKGCGDAYITAESDFLYRPSALFVMDGLIEACDAVRARLDARLEVNARAAKTLPNVDDDIKDTDAGKYLEQLTGNSSLGTLENLIAASEVLPDTIDDLREQEARLRLSDVGIERRRLSGQGSKLNYVEVHLRTINNSLGDDAVAALQRQRDSLPELERAADLLAASFEAEPLRGVGTSPWSVLWEAAEKFSEGHAYPGSSFPNGDENGRCVLCQQVLDTEARERLARFAQFVREDARTRARDARSAWDRRLQSLPTLHAMDEHVEGFLRDLEIDHADLVQRARLLLSQYEGFRAGIIKALSGSGEVPLSGLRPDEIIAALESASLAARREADSLSDLEEVRRRLDGIRRRRKERELLQELRSRRASVAEEIGRLRDRHALEAIMNAAATGPITRKVLELTEESITEVVRDTFTRESDRLRLERVTMNMTRGDKGAVLHQPKLVGARQSVTLPRVFSEGERTVLGLAAFFTEAQLDASKSALILDDPVSSLDHVRREQVAARLAALADSRQIIVLTHDVSFVGDIKREAKAVGVSVCERSVARGRGGERKPGACSVTLPWKAKDVPERLNELRESLSRIKRECAGWDERTYENEVASWSGGLSETWERIFSQEVVGQIVAEGGLELRPRMVRILARFSVSDDGQFQASYGRVSQWAKRHDKSPLVNYVAPEIATLEAEFELVSQWFKRVKGYQKE